MRRPALFRCDACNATMIEADILRVNIPLPKSKRGSIQVAQCPECGNVNEWTNVCDEPGCAAEATCGWPTKDADYRRTCGKHMEANAHERAK